MLVCSTRCHDVRHLPWATGMTTGITWARQKATITTIPLLASSYEAWPRRRIVDMVRYEWFYNKFQ
jgi:hypothetical protein